MFILCWIFFFVKYTFCGESNRICPEFIVHNPVLGDILFWIGYFNSMINPFLYNFTNPDFQRAFMKLLNIKQKTWKKKQSNASKSIYLSQNNNNYLSANSLNQINSNNSANSSLNGKKIRQFRRCF